MHAESQEKAGAGKAEWRHRRLLCNLRKVQQVIWSRAEAIIKETLSLPISTYLTITAVSH